MVEYFYYILCRGSMYKLKLRPRTLLNFPVQAQVVVSIHVLVEKWTGWHFTDHQCLFWL